jgi:hypothetical protein
MTSTLWFQVGSTGEDASRPTSDRSKRIADRYSEAWVRERFGAHGITYEISRWSRSDLYVELLPLLTSRRARLPTNRG